MRTVPRFLGLLLVFALTFVARASDPAEMKDDFAWFGSLNFSDIQGLPFVRYVSGWSPSAGDAEAKPLWDYGWLLTDSPDNFTIRTPTLEFKILSKSGKDLREKSSFEPGDLGKCAKELLKPREGRIRWRFGSGPRTPERTKLFILAWMCSRNGLDEPAAQLYPAAAESREVIQERPLYISDGKRHHDEDWPFRQRLERDLGAFEIWNVILDFRDLKVTRPQLLARLQAFPKRFPHCDYIRYAAELAGQLEKMIPEDEAHPLLTEEQIAKLSPEEQAREWIFRLRDENVAQTSQPGSVRFFARNDFRKAAPVLATHQLATLGDAAIPALIEALEDHRLVRSVEFERDYYLSHHVLTVGDAALQTLEELAGRSFYPGENIQREMTRAEVVALVKPAVQAWWKERLAKGRLAELSEATAAGSFNSAEVGKRLLEDFPLDAADPILAGAAAATTPYAHSEFVRLVARLKDERVPGFLLREVRAGKGIGDRAYAAHQLARLGRLDGIEILEQVWKTTTPPSELFERSNRELLLEALVLADSPAALQTLAEGLRRRTLACRKKILDALLPGHQVFPYITGILSAQQPAPEISAPTKTAIENLLGAELEGDGCPESNSLYTLKQGVIFRSPRLCDLAAVSLAARRPEKYAFDPMAAFDVRERQRLTILNVFRSAHGLPALPLPAPRPAVAPEDAGKIAEVCFAGGELKAPEPVLALLRGAKGRAIDSAFFQELRKTFLDACAGQPPRQNQGLMLFALRENDRTGMTLIVSPAERAAAKEEQPREWRIQVSATLDGRDPVAAEEDQLFDVPAVQIGTSFPVSPASTPRPLDILRQRLGFPSIESVLEMVEALPQEKPLGLIIEIAPARRAEDDAI